MQTVVCDLTGETIENGVPNYGRGVHSFLIDADKDISVNVSFQGTGNGLISDTGRPQGVWSGQSTGGVNLSKAGLVAALNAAKDTSKVVVPAVKSAQSTGNAVLPAIDDLVGGNIAAGDVNYGRGTKTVTIDAAKGITMQTTFFRGNAGGVDLTAAGFTAAMEAARLKAADAAGVKALSGNHIPSMQPSALPTEEPGNTRPV